MTDPTTSEAGRPRPARKRDRYHQDRALLDALLDEVHLGHFGMSTDAGPVVFPSLIARDGDRILTHGSTGSGWLRAMSQGAPVSLAVTTVDALVVARSGFHSSMVYRSAVLFGSCTLLQGAEKAAALHHMTDSVIPGRGAEVRDHLQAELAQTMILAIPIDDWTYKARPITPTTGDDESDLALDIWAGFVPVRTAYGDPQPSPDLRDGIPVPASIQGLPR